MSNSQNLTGKTNFLGGVVGINAVSNEAAIIDILMARGFLIESYEGSYYLSDNAAFKDAKDLEDGLAEFELGSVVYDNDYYEIKTREPWHKESLTRSETYKSLLPRKVRIDLREDASIEDAWDFFHSNTCIGFEVCYVVHDWSKFLRIEFPPKVAAMLLEPYVAFYVKAASSCGVYTYFSCDGNHKKGGSVIVRSEEPSNIWHECIWEYVIRPRFGDIPYIDKDGIRFNVSNQALVYQEIYRIAKFLYRNRFSLRYVKAKASCSFSKKAVKSLSYEEIGELFKSRCVELFKDRVFVL